MSEDDGNFTTFIQWKNTNLCMDFNCPECGTSSHYDGFFAFVIRCPGCASYFEMPSEVPIKRLAARPEWGVLEAQPEDDE